MGLLQAVQQLEEVLGRHALIHALILCLYVDICIQRVLLDREGRIGELSQEDGVVLDIVVIR